MHNKNVLQRWGLKKNWPKIWLLVTSQFKRKDKIIIIIIKTNKKESTLYLSFYWQ